MRTLMWLSFIFGVSLLLLCFALRIIRQQTPRSPWIIFVSNRDGDFKIYRMRPDGTQITRLTSGADAESSPTWSPDGRWIAFTRSSTNYATSNTTNTQVGGNIVYLVSVIYLMRPTGAEVHPLLDAQINLPSLTWSPDGKRLAFNAQLGNEVGIFEIDPKNPDDLKLLVEGFSLDHPVWSPDGKWLALENWDTYPNTLFLVKEDGSELAPANEATFALTDPEWSPTGDQLAVRALNNDGISPDYLGLIPASGGEVQKVPHTDFFPSALSWSPDGEWIAFTRHFENIYRIRPNGEDLTQLTNGSGYDSEPAWSPVIDLPLRMGWLLAAALGLMVVGLGINAFHKAPLVYGGRFRGGLQSRPYRMGDP